MLYWYLNKYDRQQGAVKVSSLMVYRKSSSWKSTFRHAPFVLRLLAVSSIIMAMARPQTRNDEELKNGRGIDIILCMDVSGSMLAQDFLPDRLEASKQMAANFVDMRPTDRIGVVIFSGESFTLVPLTTDKAVLKTQIYNIQRGLLEDGTAIGDGLGVSVDRLKNVKTKSKVIILLTDGEDQGGRIDPLAGKELAKAYGVRVYTIGVGSEGFAPVPVPDAGGGVTTRQQKVNIDEKLLRMIATETGGLYFRARDNESLKRIYAEIDKLEKSRIDTITRSGAGAVAAWRPAAEGGVTAYLVSYGPADDPTRHRRTVTGPRAELPGATAGMTVQVKAVGREGIPGWDWARGVVE